ncbi:MAG: VanZ family protein [Pseudomonadota bacterium]|nr:VanZ family protein [Pseudomonadota bacterium]
MKWLTIAYSILLLLIIWAANQGSYQSIFKLVYVLPFGDKLGHFILIGFLALIVNLTWHCARFKCFKWQLLKGSALVLGIVVLEELSQLFIASRTFDLGDLVFDCLGIWVSGHLAQFLTGKCMAIP